ncbi:hypothetical protein [Lactococcus garvieae]|uniref:hypothetical protein n=1 Tax=Lactococcus garvieae TaxID=1363 RepID=UPI00254D644D|nr:hypothetical protein [Lactococcus garvieae]
MGLLLAFLGGGLSLLNFSAEWQSLPMQFIFTLLSLSSMFVYKGKRTRKSYEGDGTSIFTLGFALCFLSFIGSASILLALFMGWQ